ncbi:unnamed protein product [Malus baccata var. baccata]
MTLAPDIDGSVILIRRWAYLFHAALHILSNPPSPSKFKTRASHLLITFFHIRLNLLCHSPTLPGFSSQPITGNEKKQKDLFASELLRSSFTRANGIRSKDLEGHRIINQRKFRVSAKIKKGKNYDYLWPHNIDPNISSGHLSYLSHFKPLTEKPKQVTLPFEKPLVDLNKKFTEIRRMADETSLDFSDQIAALENKYQQWVELHGDRACYDDPAIVTGLGSMDGQSYMFIGHQKGRNTKENIARNFAMPTPHDYRKVLKMMKYADHHRFPIVTFVDTPGAFADLKFEELGQGEAIAQNLRTMFGLKVPIIMVVTGEGGLGGVLAIACSNKLFMLENSVFYIASPKVCTAILWKSSQTTPKVAKKLRIMTQEHYRLKIADGIIPHQRLKFRLIGGYQEGIPMELKRKRNIKPSEVNMPRAADLEAEIENLKKKILEAKGPSDPVTIQIIEKLKQDVDKKMANAFISMGLQEKLEAVKLELSKASEHTPSQPLNRNLKEKVDKIMQEFNHNLSRPGAYLGLKLIEVDERKQKLKAKINQRIPAELKEKMELLKNAREKTSKGEATDKDLMEEVEGSANLEVVGVTKKNVVTAPPELKEKIVKANAEIYEDIERVVNEAGISGRIEELRADIAKVSSSSEERKKAEAKINEDILAILNVEALKAKVESLTVEVGLPNEIDAEGKISAENGKF